MTSKPSLEDVKFYEIQGNPSSSLSKYYEFTTTDDNGYEVKILRKKPEKFMSQYQYVVEFKPKCTLLSDEYVYEYFISTNIIDRYKRYHVCPTYDIYMLPKPCVQETSHKIIQWIFTDTVNHNINSFPRPTGDRLWATVCRSETPVLVIRRHQIPLGTITLIYDNNLGDVLLIENFRTRANLTVNNRNPIINVDFVLQNIQKIKELYMKTVMCIKMKIFDNLKKVHYESKKLFTQFIHKDILEKMESEDNLEDTMCSILYDVVEKSLTGCGSIYSEYKHCVVKVDAFSLQNSTNKTLHFGLSAGTFGCIRTANDELQVHPEFISISKIKENRNILVVHFINTSKHMSKVLVHGDIIAKMNIYEILTITT